jgi:thymidylate synthase (FAD)
MGVKIVPPSVALEWMTPNPLAAIEMAGRTCYQSEPAGDSEGFVRKILARGHESVIEHAVASFRVVTDRGVTHEMVRHRLASYSQESTRYCAYPGELTVIEPPNLGDAYAAWRGGVEAASCAYDTMLARGMPPQIARSVLPNCLKTEIVMTANFREWRHFLRLRGSAAAHPQIRQIARMIFNQFRELCPVALTGIEEPLSL